jgi:hypothetical protein
MILLNWFKIRIILMLKDKRLYRLEKIKVLVRFKVVGI